MENKSFRYNTFSFQLNVMKNELQRRIFSTFLVIHQQRREAVDDDLLVEGLGVGGGGRNVGIAGSLVRAGGELELVGSLEVGVAGLAVGAGVILEVEKLADHLKAENYQKIQEGLTLTAMKCKITARGIFHFCNKVYQHYLVSCPLHGPPLFIAVGVSLRQQLPLRPSR